MAYRQHKFRLSTWAIPALYAAAAIVAGLTFPRFESQNFPGLVHPMNVSVTITLYSSIASGMLALTSIVFSLIFVMVQFSATAYSPRLALWVARDPVISHSLGVFTATFLYALGALRECPEAGRKRSHMPVPFGLRPPAGEHGHVHCPCPSDHVPSGQPHVDFHWRSRTKVISTMYPSLISEITPTATEDFRALPQSQMLIHHGRPRSVQAVDVAH